MRGIWSYVLYKKNSNFSLKACSRVVVKSPATNLFLVGRVGCLSWTAIKPPWAPSAWLRHKANQGWRASESQSSTFDERDFEKLLYFRLPEGGLGLLPDCD